MTSRRAAATPRQTSFAGAFLAKTCPPQAEAPACKESDRACGGISPPPSTKSVRASSSLKTSRRVHANGCPRCGVTCTCSVTTPPPSRFLPPTSERPISANESSLLPTLTARPYGSNIGGAAGRAGPSRPSLETMASRGTLPTLTRCGNMLAPSMQKWPAHRRLPTLVRRDDHGPGPPHTKGGQDLPQSLGGHLAADWCRWFMGFPAGWLDVNDESESAPSATPLSRSAPK